jgi:hypothetical protein
LLLVGRNQVEGEGQTQILDQLGMKTCPQEIAAITKVRKTLLVKTGSLCLVLNAKVSIT